MALTFSSPVASQTALMPRRRLSHVFFKSLVGETLVWVHPRNDENGVSLGHRPLDEGLLGVEIEDVELVDPGRHDQKRALEHMFRLASYWMSWKGPVLTYDFAGRDGEVASDLKLAEFRLLEVAPAALDVLGEELHPANEVLSVGGKGLAQEPGFVNTQFDGASAFITCFM